MIMKSAISVAIVAICILLPMVLMAQQTKEVPPTQPVATISGAGESPDLAVGIRSPGGQDKPPLPYDQAPEAKTTVQPKYPDLATRAGIEGTVWTKVFIDETGKVTKVTISKSDAEILNQPSIDAAMQWVFKPAMKDGKPIAVDVAIPFRFKVQKGPMIPDYSQPGWAPLSVAVTERAGYRVMWQHPYLLGQSPTQTTAWYPESAVKDGFEGIVMLKLTLNVGGRVERVEVTGHAREDLDSVAVQLARTWTFIPGQASGVPEKCIIQVPISFHLPKQAK
jgi:TonB family protein